CARDYDDSCYFDYW
nr:immunoglobulin heavy chain junction region [Mus musculus]